LEGGVGSGVARGIMGSIGIDGGPKTVSPAGTGPV